MVETFDNPGDNQAQLDAYRQAAQLFSNEVMACFGPPPRPRPEAPAAPQPEAPAAPQPEPHLDTPELRNRLQTISQDAQLQHGAAQLREMLGSNVCEVSWGAVNLLNMLNSQNATERTDGGLLLRMLNNPQTSALARVLMTDMRISDADQHHLLSMLNPPAQAPGADAQRAAGNQIARLLTSANEADQLAGIRVLSMLSGNDATARTDGRVLLAMLNDPAPAKQQMAREILAIPDAGQRHIMVDLAADPQTQPIAREILQAGIGDWRQAAAMIALWGWLRGLMGGQRPQGPPSDLVPHINGQRFTVPMGGETTLRSLLGEVSFHDGPPTNMSTERAALRRTERGWEVRSVGVGFYHQPAGATQFTLVPPGSSVTLGANDQIRLGPEAGDRILTFRAEAPVAAAAPDAGQMQMRVTTDGRARNVEIIRPDGTIERVRLNCSSGWASAPYTGSHDSPIKVHINVQNSADLLRLQPAVIEALLTDPVLRRLVTGWKTCDPNHALGESARAHGSAPNGLNQSAKGFTIYCANAEDAALVQQRLSQIIHERGLGLAAPINTGNVDHVDARTNRVGLVRDTWPITSDRAGRQGYLLDAELSRRIHEHFQLGEGQMVSARQRRQLERDLGLRPNTLTYDHSGRLMMRATDLTLLEYHGAAYANEMNARTPQGLTDRPALYALYERFQVNPVEQARAASDHSLNRPSGLSSEGLQREFTQIADRLSADPFLRNTALVEFSRRMEALENQLRSIADPTARRTAIQNAMQLMIREMAPTLGNSVVGRLAGVTVVAAPELDMPGAAQGRQIFRHRDGSVLRPRFVDGNEMVVEGRDNYGRPAPRRIPLSDITLELQVPASAISADLSTEQGAGRFRRMLATVYEQIDRAHRFGSLTRAEATNPQVVTGVARTGDVIADYLHRDLQANSDPFTRRSPDYNGLQQEQLNRAAESLVNAFRNRAITQGLMSDRAVESFVAEFRSLSDTIYGRTGATARALEIQNLVREVLSRPGMQIGIAADNIIVESSSTAGGSGQQLIRHAGGQGQPAVEGVLVGREGNNVQIRLASGEVVSRPVGQVQLVIRLPEAQLNHATASAAEGATPLTRAAAHDVASTVYRFLAQADAVLNGRAQAGTSLPDLGRMTEIAAQRLQFELNAHRLTPNHNLPPVQLSQVDVARVISSPQPRGAIHAITENGVTRYELVDGTTRRALNNEEKERLERQLSEYHERVYAESIDHLRRRANDTALPEAEREQYRLALDAVERDLNLYRTNPQRRADVHNTVSRQAAGPAGAGWRSHIGTGTRVLSGVVVLLILSETARAMAQRQGAGGNGGLQVVPVR